MVDATDTAAGAEAPDEPAVAIRVTRLGGVAGIRRRWRVEAMDATAWEPLVEACPWEEPIDTPPTPDRFVWVIEVQAPEPARTAELPEQALEGPWRELVDHVRSEGEPVRAARRAEGSHG